MFHYDPWTTGGYFGPFFGLVLAKMLMFIIGNGGKGPLGWGPLRYTLYSDI